MTCSNALNCVPIVFFSVLLPRVVPLHTLKYGATLQQTAGSTELQHDKPLLVRVDVKAGHGAGKPTSKVIDEICDTLLFAALALDVKSADA